MKKGKRIILSIVFIAVIFYILALGYLYFAQRSLLYLPDKTRPNANDFHVSHYNDVEVTTEDGVILQSWYLPADKPNGDVILYFHGNGGFFAGRAFKAVPYLQAGYDVLLAEYRGYGGNPGSPSEAGFFNDGAAYMKWLLEKGKAPKNIIIYGESIGNGVAIKMAASTPVKALVLESPYSSIADVAKYHHPFFPVYFLMKDQFQNMELIQTLSMPKLFLHGDQDTIIPALISQKLYDAAAEPKQFVNFPGGTHNDLHEQGAPLQVLKFLTLISNESTSP